MDIATVISETVETIRMIPAIGDFLVVGDNGYLDEEQKMMIRQRSVYAKVWCNGFVPHIQGPTAPDEDLIGDVSIVVSVYEKPSVNRKSIGSQTCMDIARVIAKELNGASEEGMDAPMFLRRITPISELGSSPDGTAVTCDVEFETKSSI